MKKRFNNTDCSPNSKQLVFSFMQVPKKFIWKFFLSFLFSTSLFQQLSAAPGDILYQNQFSNNGDVSSDWSKTSGGGNDFQSSSATFSSSSRSLRIRDGSGGTSNSGLIDASVSGVDVTFWLRQGSPSNAPESNENLDFYYMNNTGSWVLLNTYLGSDSAGTIYNASFTLPADALHNNLRFQFDMTSGNNDDRWYVDDFVVTETGALSTSTLELHFEFNEGSGQTIADSSGNGHTGSLGDSSTIESIDPTWQCEQNSGWVMGFDGSQSQHINVPSFTPPSETTVAFWMKRDSAPSSNERIYGFSSSWELRHLSGGRLSFDMNAADGPVTTSAYSSVGTWTHVAGVFSASSDTWEIYINGALVQNGTNSQSPQPAGNLLVGASAWQSNAEHWNGNLEDFRIYDGLLSAAEVAALAAAAPVDCSTPGTFSCDDFESGFANWSINSSGGDAGISGATFNSANNSMYTRWGDVTVTSITVSTASFTEVEVKAWVRRGDDSFSENPETGEDLVISYLNASNNWIVLETFNGGSTQGEIFDRSYTLPSTAIHSNFKLRIQQTDGDNSDWDYWHIDDVCIQEYDPPPIGSCAVYFPDTIQGHASGSELIFDNNGRILNDPDNIITIANLDDGANGNTCTTTDCTITGTSTPALTLPTFITTSVSTDISLSGGTSVIGPGGGYAITEIDNLTIQNSANVTFSASASTYIIDNGLFDDNSQITFNPGTYWFDELEIIGSANIIINGPVTIFVNNHFDIEDDVTLNSGGAASDLAIVTYEEVHIKDDAVVKAVLYSIGDNVEIRDDAQFTGAISAADEIVIEDSGTVIYEAVGNVQVADLCGPVVSLDHIEITNDGSALTCTDETLTIRACANADCSSVATSDVSVILSDNGVGASIWSSNPVTIPANSSAGVNVSLTHRTAETITLSAVSTPVAANSLVCSPAGCDLTFDDAGFILTLNNHQSCSTPNLTIQAVKLSDTGTSCAPAYTGSQSVNFSFDYSNPSSGSVLPILATTDMAAATSIQNRSIAFDGSASASLSFQYNDAGELSITVADAANAGLSSASITPVIFPAKLIVSTSDTDNACTGDYGNCSPFKVAGVIGNAASVFNLSVAGACANNTITPNFQLSNIPLTSNLIAPDPSLGTNATLGVTSVNITTGGTVTVAQAVSEVGAFSISATPGSYMGETIPAATSSTIGRFVPDRFSVSVNNPTDTPYFADASCGFTYQDQEFGFGASENPVITITALNSAGAVTQNYGGFGIANNNFWKLDATKLSTRNYINQIAAFSGSLDFSLLSSTIVIAGTADYDGINTFSIEGDLLTYSKSGVTPVTTADANFDSLVTLNFTAESLTDTDGVFYDADNNNVRDNALDDFDITDIGSTNIRWGRWFIENAFGSELQPLIMTAEAQYFDGTDFVINTDDTCSATITTITPSLTSYGGNLVDGDTTLSSGTMVSGLLPFTLSAPGNSNDGSLLLTIPEPDWLMYDYDGDGTADDASATATFGIFEGRKPVIFWRQRY